MKALNHLRKAMSERKIYKPRPVSGFPEWLPEVRMVEQQWLDHIRRGFEAYGFCSIETPAVEELAVIEAKGGDGGADVDKEVYVLERLHKEPGDKEARLALHFDQTVPLARYVAQHFNELTFPFKRYQMQKVWRGERPQAGRFREFYQCDIDVINVDQLPLHFDAEMPAIIWEVLSTLPGMEGEKIQIRVSNRKIVQGFLESQGIKDEILRGIILRAIDKSEKMSKEELLEYIHSSCKESGSDFQLLKSQTDPYHLGSFMALALLKLPSSESLIKGMDKKLMENKTFSEGVEELAFVMDQLGHLRGDVVVDLSIVRGLDYYTGTVYETVFVDDPGYGSICSGGRYDDLASSYINKKLPGVGISIGFSRLFDRLYKQGKFNDMLSRKSPADVLVVLPSEERRPLTAATAMVLRQKGYNVETYHSDAKIKKQMEYASKKGIPYVWFPPFEEGQEHEVKNMKTGEQTKADPQEWEA